MFNKKIKKEQSDRSKDTYQESSEKLIAAYDSIVFGERDKEVRGIIDIIPNMST